MTDETNDAWMKPSPPSPWRILGWRFLGCLVASPLSWFCGRLFPVAVDLFIYLPLALWLLCLIAFCRARFWVDSRALWGRLAIAGPGWYRCAMRVLATLLTLALGLPAFLLGLIILAIPFAVGPAP